MNYSKIDYSKIDWITCPQLSDTPAYARKQVSHATYSDNTMVVRVTVVDADSGNQAQMMLTCGTQTPVWTVTASEFPLMTLNRMIEDCIPIADWLVDQMLKLAREYETNELKALSESVRKVSDPTL